MVNQLIKELEKKLTINPYLVVGIDGRAASGKTTISKYLKEYFDATIIHVDDYFLPSIRKTEKRLKQPGGNFDYERMEKEIFHHINDEYFHTNHFNCTTQELRVKEPTKRKNLVIIEGVYSLHPRFQPYYDYKVFIDIDKELQYDRILQRSNQNMLIRFQNEFLPLEELYFTSCKIKDTVDLLLKN